MKKKITISIDERILEIIKKKAKCENRTTSNCIEVTINKAIAEELRQIPKIEVEK